MRYQRPCQEASRNAGLSRFDLGPNCAVALNEQSEGHGYKRRTRGARSHAASNDIGGATEVVDY